MDEMRQQFEDMVKGGNYSAMMLEIVLKKDSSGKYGYLSTQDRWIFFQAAWKASLVSQPIAYMTHHGSAVSPDDFADGEEEMHQAAKTEGWTPLIAGITGGVD